MTDSYLDNVTEKLNTENLLRREEDSFAVNRLVFNEDRVKIMLMSDEHIGAHTHRSDIHLDYLSRAYEKQWYVIHLGDCIEAATRNSIGSGVYTQDEIIDQQVSIAISRYMPFAQLGTLLGMHVGNHEARAFNDDGVNIMRMMCRTLKVKYFGIAKPHLIRVGNQTYTMYTTHGASGARMTHTKIKGCLDLEKVIDVDVYCMGHLHQLSHHVRNYYEIDRRNKKIRTREKNFILTGSFLDYVNSYAQVKGLEPGRMGCPVMELYGDRHKIKVSLGSS